MSSAPEASRCCRSMTPLVDALHARGFEIGIETNGTLMPPSGIDWICVSPKAGADFVLKRGDELKLVFPQDGAEPDRYAGLHFRHFFLQPMDGPRAPPTPRPPPPIALPIPNGGFRCKLISLSEFLDLGSEYV